MAPIVTQNPAQRSKNQERPCPKIRDAPRVRLLGAAERVGLIDGAVCLRHRLAGLPSVAEDDGRLPDAEFSMAGVLPHYVTDIPPGTWFRGSELAIVVRYWLGDLMEGKEDATLRTGLPESFLAAIRGGTLTWACD